MISRFYELCSIVHGGQSEIRPAFREVAFAAGMQTSSSVPPYICLMIVGMDDGKLPSLIPSLAPCRKSRWTRRSFWGPSAQERKVGEAQPHRGKGMALGSGSGRSFRSVIVLFQIRVSHEVSLFSLLSLPCSFLYLQSHLAPTGSPTFTRNNSLRCRHRVHLPVRTCRREQLEPFPQRKTVPDFLVFPQWTGYLRKLTRRFEGLQVSLVSNHQSQMKLVHRTLSESSLRDFPPVLLPGTLRRRLPRDCISTQNVKSPMHLYKDLHA